MCKVKALKPYTVHVKDGMGSMARVVRVCCNARRRKVGVSLEELEGMGLVEPPGCNCGHCAQGWDCCGRLFPSWVEIRRVRGGFKVLQRYSRNI